LKRITIILFAAVLVSALCACGAEKPGQSPENASGIPGVIEEIDPETADTEKIKADFDKASEYIGSVVDTSDADINTDDEDPANIYGYWNFDPDKYPFEPETELMVSGQKIVIGQTTVGEIEGMGFKLEKPMDMIGPDDMTSVTLSEGGKSILLEVNLPGGGEEKPIEDVAVQGFNSGSAEYALPYEYMGISGDMSLEKVIDVLGVPNSDLHVNSEPSGVTIELSYYNNSEADGFSVDTTFSISFSYDTENNNTAITSALMSRRLYKPE